MKKTLLAISILALAVTCVRAQYISTFAGNGTKGYAGNGGLASAAEFNYPEHIIIDASGNLYIADNLNNAVRKINTAGKVSTIAGNTAFGYAGDGGPATAAELGGPNAVAIDSSGNIYIADYSNNVIRKINSSGTISTFAGNHTQGYTGDGGAATSAELNNPTDVAVDDSGSVFIVDNGNNAIRKVNKAGTITTYAGNGAQGFYGDGGAATAAELATPYGIAVDSAQNVYIADSRNNCIREVNAAGIISTIAGTGSIYGGYTGDGFAATSAKLNWPQGVAIDKAGNIYIADYSNHVIRIVNKTGIINTFAGDNIEGYTGDGGLAVSAELNYPWGISVDKFMNVYISDNGNNVIRKVNSPLGINELNSNADFSIYPNPFSTTVHIVFNSGSKHYIELDDITGRKMEAVEFTGTEYELNRNGLAAGVYFIRASDEGRRLISTVKVIVM